MLRTRRAREAIKTHFRKCWSIYPHKVDQVGAERAHRFAIDGGADPDEVLTGLQRYVDTKPPDRQWLNLATFFAKERWRDEPAQTSPLLPISGTHEAIGRAERPLREADQWPARLFRYFVDQQRDISSEWLSSSWGPKPDEPGCRAPAEVIAAARERARSAAAARATGSPSRA